MKRFFFSIIVLLATASAAFSQEDVTLFFLNDGSFKGFYDEEIDSIAYSNFDLDSIWHDDPVVQEIWLADSVVRIPIETIDSICHHVPPPVFMPEVIHLDERYLPYITSVDGMTITFSPDLPESLRPHQGDILLYDRVSDLFPVGFAGRVSAEGNQVLCEEVSFTEIYEKFVFFGRYVVVDKNASQDEETEPAYALRRLKERKDDEDYGIDNWRMGDGSTGDIEVGSFKKSGKIEFKKIHTALKFDYKLTPILNIEFAYDGYWLNPLLFYKCVHTFNYEKSFSVVFSSEIKPKEDLFASILDGGKTYGIIQVEDHESDESDDDKSQSLYFANLEVPVPEFPLIKIGFKIGIFMEPKLEGEISAGVKYKGSHQWTFIYNFDKTNWKHLGDAQTYKGPTTYDKEYFLEGSMKGSIWTGFLAAASASIGFNKNAEAKEEAKFRIGPYLEGEIKADFLNGTADMSKYTLLKDSKVKAGIKPGVDVKFTAKLDIPLFGDIDANWTHLNWSPKELIKEETLYLLPDIKAPTYTTKGNTLTCTSEVTRETFPNTLGFALVDETGKEVRKYKDYSYKYRYNASVPFLLSETFDNLDFVNHRYTIVPTTRLFGLKLDLFKMDVPDDLRTAVLCPDSRHPHIIDLGLPSGTKWLCQNVYAEDPAKPGGYYQWGKPFKSNDYNEATYHSPFVNMENYQGTEYDAATANLGMAYATPTLAQFEELLDNCSITPHYSAWGVLGKTKGFYLKGKNGNNLYLPFSGYMSDKKVESDSKGKGYFLISDAKDDDETILQKKIVIENEKYSVADAGAYGYSVRAVGASTTGGLTIEPEQLEYEVYVGEKVGQAVTIRNNGGLPVTVTVSPTDAPFTVDPDLESTFTLQPKELKAIYVYFEPEELEEYESILNISYEIDNTCTVCKVPLKGKGIESSLGKGDLKVEPPFIKFGRIVVGTSKAARFKVTNESASSLTFTITEQHDEIDIPESGNQFTLEAGEDKTFEVVFKPTEADRDYGCFVRIFTEDEENVAFLRITGSGAEEGDTQAFSSCPDEHHPHMIDLGLPSGTKWSCCNVDANMPEDYGGYYAWGETEEKDSYDWSNYIHCDGSKETCHDLGPTICGTDYDVAHVKWGDTWRMPSSFQMDELLANCTHVWMTANGVNGRRFTGPNGSMIFLPASGRRDGIDLLFRGYYGYYWSGTPGPYQDVFAYYLLYFYSNFTFWGFFNIDLYYGHPVRPVAR